MMQENVLVVDDHPEIRDLMVKILERRGYRVSTASDGHDALTQFALVRPDLVITDLSMPGLNGYQLCRLIRGISSVPVLIMSAQKGVEEKAYEMGPMPLCPNPSTWKPCGLRSMNCCWILAGSRTVKRLY